MVDYHNAATTYCILIENNYVIYRSEPARFTVHCPYDRCRWRLHASHMLRSKFIQVCVFQFILIHFIFRSLCNVFLTIFCLGPILFQIKKNPHQHTCPPRGGGGKAKTKLAKTRWVADAILDWLRETPTLGPTTLRGKLFE